MTNSRHVVVLAPGRAELQPLGSGQPLLSSTPIIIRQESWAGDKELDFKEKRCASEVSSLGTTNT